MYQLILMLHVLIAVVLIGLVLMQHGKGADIGAAFGSGASSTIFGSQGVGSFLFRTTCILALAFFVTSVSLSYLLSSQYQKAKQQTALVKEALPNHKSNNILVPPINNK